MRSHDAETIEFRPVSIEDPVVVELLAVYQAELHTMGVPLNRCGTGGVTAAEFEPPAGRFLLATDDGGSPGGRPVGCGGVRLLTAEVAEIKRMYVSPRCRRSGLARRLLAALESDAAAFGARVLRLDTGASMHSAIGLYEATGYHRIEDYNGNPDAAHWFEKFLT